MFFFFFKKQLFTPSPAHSSQPRSKRVVAGLIRLVTRECRASSPRISQGTDPGRSVPLHFSTVVCFFFFSIFSLTRSRFCNSEAHPHGRVRGSIPPPAADSAGASAAPGSLLREGAGRASERAAPGRAHGRSLSLSSAGSPPSTAAKIEDGFLGFCLVKAFFFSLSDRRGCRNFQMLRKKKNNPNKI